MSNIREGYDPVAKSIHWLMAALIIALFLVGLTMESLPRGDFRGQVIGLHKSFGVVVLALLAVRVVWRLGMGSPSLPATMPPLEVKAAKLGHLALYVLMAVIPVVGILMSQTGGRPVAVLGWVLPTLMGKDEALHELFEEIHAATAWLLAAVVLVHVGAALRHHFMLKDDVMTRMLPRR